jgi:anthranilate phosphoribosyltransferase
MNLLGPCVNPARPPVQLLGVSDPKMLRRIAQVLAALGVTEALIVHGGGLDEVALHAETRAIRLSGGNLEELVLTPEEAGCTRTALKALEGGDPAVNAERLRALLEGGGTVPEQEAVALNAGALLWTAGLATDLREGTSRSLDALRSGAAGRVLAAFIEMSRG